MEFGLVNDYGRVDLGTGILVNLTDGGKGSINFKHKKETIFKISGKNNHKYGKGHLQIGDKNPMYGRKGEKSPTFGSQDCRRERAY